MDLVSSEILLCFDTLFIYFTFVKLGISVFSPLNTRIEYMEHLLLTLAGFTRNLFVFLILFYITHSLKKISLKFPFFLLHICNTAK